MVAVGATFSCCCTCDTLPAVDITHQVALTRLLDDDAITILRRSAAVPSARPFHPVLGACVLNDINHVATHTTRRYPSLMPAA